MTAKRFLRQMFIKVQNESKAGTLLNFLLNYNGNAKVQAKRFVRKISRQRRSESKTGSLLNSCSNRMKWKSVSSACYPWADQIATADGP